MSVWAQPEKQKEDENYVNSLSCPEHIGYIELKGIEKTLDRVFLLFLGQNLTV